MLDTKYIVIAILIIIVLATTYWVVIEHPLLYAEDTSTPTANNGLSNGDVDNVIKHGEYSDKISFDEIGGKNISLDEFRNAMGRKGINIYLPTRLPDGYKLSAIWASNKSPVNEQEFFIIVYSKDGSTSPRCGSNRVGIEIYIGAGDTDLIASYGANASSIIKEDNMEAVILSNSYCGWNDRPQVAAYVKIGDVLYAIMGDISVSEMVNLVRSMKPITQIS